MVEAVKDYRYLLNRGYNQEPALDLVTSRYLLSKEERMLLYRCVHPSSEASAIRSSSISSDLIRNETLVVDGYNVLITVASALEGRTLYLCDDGFVRDLRSVKVKDFTSPSIERAIYYLKEAINELTPQDTIIFLDKNVSWSKKHGEIIQRKLALKVKVIYVKKADRNVISAGGVVATSDYLILKSTQKSFDLAGNIIRKHFPQRMNTEIHSLLSR